MGTSSKLAAGVIFVLSASQPTAAQNSISDVEYLRLQSECTKFAWSYQDHLDAESIKDGGKPKKVLEKVARYNLQDKRCYLYKLQESFPPGCYEKALIDVKTGEHRALVTGIEVNSECKFKSKPQPSRGWADFMEVGAPNALAFIEKRIRPE